MLGNEEEGFLTEEQRLRFAAASEAVIEAKESIKEQTGPRPNIEHATKHVPTNAKHHPIVPVKQERKSHAVKNGRPKKGGSGGKGTWGNPLVLYPDSGMDQSDPNYDSDEEPYNLVGAPVAESLEEYKKKVLTIVEEYFCSGDISSAAADLKDLGSPSYHHHFVKRLVSLAFDRHDREKEMASELLSALYADVIRPEQMWKGFTSLLENLEDLELDCPNASGELAVFLSRAVVDDVLPPAFLLKAGKTLAEGSKGLATIRLADAQLATPHHAERVERCWGGQSQTTVDGAKAKIAQLLEEYLASGDSAEAYRRVRALNMPFFHHEVVKRAWTMAMENDSSHTTLFDLLREAAEEGLITSSQMNKGLRRVADEVEDLALDVPNAKEKFQQYVDEASRGGWLHYTASAANGSSRKYVGDDAPASSPELGAMRDYKATAGTIVAEYFESGEVAEVARSLEELGSADYLPLFLKKLITMAMDRKNREREMASSLLSGLFPEVVTSEHIQVAFTNLLDSVEDLALDIPDAASELSLFLARAIVDDVMPPLVLLEAAKLFPEESLAFEVVETTQAMLAARHAGERVLRCWGAGAGRTVDDTKDKIGRLLEEYEAGGDLSEACLCVRDLGTPFYHHEVVKQALVMALEKQNERPLVLLQEGAKEGLISTDQMLKGFLRVKEYLPDLGLDLPDARGKFEKIVRDAQEQHWLSSSFSTGQDV